MANYANLLATIATNVYQNTSNAVTADMVKTALNAMVASLGAGYQCLGVADLSTPAITPDYKCFYIVSTPGTYANFNNLVVNDGEVCLFKWDSAWSKEVTGAITQAKVAELGQKVGDFSGSVASSVNLLNKSASGVMLGYRQVGASPQANASYNLSDYIQVTPGALYTSSAVVAYWTFFGPEKVYVTNQFGGTQATIPTGCYYARLSYNTGYWASATFTKGATATTEEYDLQLNQAIGIHEQAKQFLPCVGDEGGISHRMSIGTMSNTGDYPDLYYPAYVKKAQIVSIYANFSSFAELYIGKGWESRNGAYIKIDGTNVTPIWCNTSGTPSSGTPIAHGLTLDGFIQITLTSDLYGVCKVYINTMGGNNSATISVQNWENSAGDFFVRSNGTAGTNVVYSVLNSDLRRRVWVLGDSYCSVSNKRWPKILQTQGITNYMIQALSGGNSSTMLADLRKALNFGTPHYIVWCLGMNDGSDTDASTPSSGWLSAIQSVISICEDNGITPILATIPCTASINHEGKNAWVKASGERYIDFAKAVNGETYTSGVDNWYTGYNDDGTHPTDLGAKALAARVLVDFPEIMQY